MRLKNSRGESLMSIVIAVALLGVLALFAGSAVFQISRNLKQDDQQKRLESLDADVANLLALPQMCTCNLAPLQIKVTAAPLHFKNNQGLYFYFDPPTPTNINAQSCQKPDTANPVVQVGQTHSESQLKITDIAIGPYYPLGPSNATFRAQDYMATVTVSFTGMEHPFQTQILVATSGGIIQFCGKRTGQVPYNSPIALPANYSKGLYRYSQFSLNFACPNPLPPVANPQPPNPHPAQSESYIFTRNQYFWPIEEGDFITEFEVGRIANTPISPVGFSALSGVPPNAGVSTFSGASTCFQETGVGDSVHLMVPTYNENQCDNLTNQFINRPLLADNKIIDAGFSLVDNCASRF